jgi:hypothetical protein
VANPKTRPYDYFLRGAEAAATSLEIELLPSPVENAADIESVIESVARVPNSGLLLPPHVTTNVNRDLIIALAARYRLPAIYALRDFVVAGGLVAYSSDIIEQNRQAASYVDQILRGANPAELPVQAPTKFQTFVNLKTARTLGLDVPALMLVRADEVIESRVFSTVQKCPLLAQSGHAIRAQRCPLSEVKPRWLAVDCPPLLSISLRGTARHTGGEDGFAKISSGRRMPMRGGALSAKGFALDGLQLPLQGLPAFLRGGMFRDDRA